MNLRDIVLNYLTDNEKGMQQLITWFLNDVMNEEVAQQEGSSIPIHDVIIREFIGNKIGNYQRSAPKMI